MRTCARCVMDTTDPAITFDEAGRCNHCLAAERRLKASPASLPPAEREAARLRLVEEVRRSGAGGRYDCVIGVSGGVDSTYLAYLAKECGLKPLAVHLDNGWDSELAVANIQGVLEKLGIDLFTHVIDWEEFKDLQLSFLKASTPDAEVPTDHAIVSLLYRVAAREGVRHILAGTNAVTESILPLSWSRGHEDWKYIRSVHRRHGSRPLKTFPHRSLGGEIYYRWGRGIRWVSFLDYFPYVKKEAMAVLENRLGWRSYGGKHHESIYTRFYQSHILPAKFGFDKRKAHLSSLIVSGQMERSEALAELAKPLYDPALLREDREYVVSKLGLTEASFEEIMRAPPRRFDDYPSYYNSWYRRPLAAAFRALKRRGWLGEAR